METQSNKIAILILNWNGYKLIKQFLPSIIKYNSLNAEIFVIDNGSNDNSISFLKKNYPQIKLIEFKINYGYAKAYNRAIKLLDHEYKEELPLQASFYKSLLLQTP